MLARTLPPVRLGNNTDWGETLQSFMLCYLARYPNIDDNPRVFISYERAWGLSNLHFVARVDGGRPAFVWAVFNYPWGKHIVIACEGLTSLGQIWNRMGGSGTYVPVEGLTGHVHSTFATYAEEILANLLATPGFTAIANLATTQITFAGFSMGAAVAEIMAYKWRRTRLTQTVRLRKWACPKFASSNWNLHRDRAVDKSSIYLVGDPVAQIPDSGWARSSSGFWALPQGYFSLQRGEESEQWDLQGERTGLAIADETFGRFSAFAWLVRSMSASNPWANHLANTYRLAITRLASVCTDLLSLRVQYLEHPDENNWQSIWRNLEIPTFAGLEVLDPAPGEFDDIRPTQQREYDTASAASGGGDEDSPSTPTPLPPIDTWGDPVDPGTLTWGIRPPEVVSTRRLRRVQAATAP